MWKRFGKWPYVSLFAAGFVFGSILCMMKKGGGTLLRKEDLCLMKDVGLDGKSLLFLVGTMRFRAVLVLLLAATTYLAPVACFAAAALWGWDIGIFMTSALGNYGIKGILLFPAAMLPQFLLYLPAFYFLLRWCEDLYCCIYQNGKWKKWESVAGLVLILGGILTGIFLECKVSPGVLQHFLKKF